MILSMTGYGAAKQDCFGMRVAVEIKSLNSKYLELNLKLPRQFAHKELGLRNECSRLMNRGKVMLTISTEPIGENALQSISINENLLKVYYQKLSVIANELDADKSELLKLALSMPDVNGQKEETAPEEEWQQVYSIFEEALQKFNAFRSNEGNELEKELILRVKNISNLLCQVEVAEPQRIPLIRERLQNLMEEYVGSEKVDNNRFEQELIYYIDKLDITEEKVRLKSHCDYFLETLALNESNGKKLGFIGQEMGREINTLGSKANNASIQQLVVQMKEELEKIKEQVLNVI